MLKAKEKIVWRKKKELLVILDTESGNYYTLNETAQDLWMSFIVGGEALEDSVNEIAGNYAEPPPADQVMADCKIIIEDWKDNGLVEEIDS